eukprot:TRINITY_DN5241_c0_g1_i1.p1 TRINITY_DN5241_c0_g1~~TRINITY_DN5241_c0_g1_i1.p1  ORF type:complete len:553 (-),score=108.44 TRINITY_DN5241_c0_g1_i1:277-1935(-)
MKKAKVNIKPKANEMENNARSMGFLDFVEPDADGKIVGLGEATPEKPRRAGSVGFLSLIDDADAPAMPSPLVPKRSATTSLPAPGFLQRNARCDDVDELFKPAEYFMLRPTRDEHMMFKLWVEKVLPRPPTAGVDPGEDGLLEITAQLCVFLWFVRQGIPWSHILPENINTVDDWGKLHKRRVWKNTPTLMLPVVTNNVIWWFNPSTPGIDSLRRKATLKICHKLQTSVKGAEEKDREFLQSKFSAFEDAVMQRQRETGELPDLARVDWTQAVTGDWMSSLKMNRDEANASTSMTLLEGNLCKRNKLGEWVNYFYVVSGSDTIPGLLSEFKAGGEGQMPRKTYRLKDYTPQEVSGSMAKKGTCFALYKEGHGAIYFKAPSKEEKIRWKNMLITYSDAPQMDVSAELFADPTVVANEKGKITQFNRAAEEMFRQTAKAVVGKNVTVLMPEPYRKPHMTYVNSYRKTRTKRIIGKLREVTILRGDGLEENVMLCVGEFVNEGNRKRAFLATFTPKESGDAMAFTITPEDAPDQTHPDTEWSATQTAIDTDYDTE